ncbi:MAG: hypothetical protein ACFHVJ_20740 [Aestuariibacter sp.]
MSQSLKRSDVQHSNYGKSNLVAGKSCIVVAPSRYMRGRGPASADFIAGFDLVVKTTDMCEMNDPVGELGSRCDIWYGMPGNASGWRVDIQALQRQGVKLMVLQPRLERYAQAWDEYFNWLNEQNVPDNIEVQIADLTSYEQWVEKLEGIPLSGVFAIFDLLQKGAKKVFAYGHDFYRTGYFFDSDFEAKTKISDWHHLDKQMQAIYQIVETDSHFQCDSNLRYLLNEKFQAGFEPLSGFRQLISSELSFFNRSYSFGNACIFRTCNIERFNQLLLALLEEQICQSLQVIVQSSVAPQLKPCDGKANVISYTGGDKFTKERLSEDLDFSVNSFDTVFVPYNGMELWTYIDIFEYCLSLQVKNVFLISLRGTVRRIDNLANECESIREYLNMRNRFNQYAQRYDRRHCI